MANRLPLTLAILALALTSCSGTGSSEGSPADEMAEIPADQLVRTADPYARGYTDQDFPRVTELAPGVFAYEQLRSAGDERFTTVSMFVVSDEGVLVADGQGSVEETRRLVDRIAEITDRPITTVVVCSDHGDHTGGNSAFPEGAAILAHPTSAAALEAMAANRSADAPPVRLATRLVPEREILRLGDREIHVLFLGRAHTGGDLVVYLPKEKILFMSEAYLHRVFPAMRSAYPSEWVTMIEAAQAMDVDVYVPGHGFVDDPAILEEELDVFKGAIRTVIAEARRLREEGYSVEDAQAQALFGDLESWSLRASQGDRAVQRVYQELDGELGNADR